jgi:tetratricopeptide (TPR) repeat protein
MNPTQVRTQLPLAEATRLAAEIKQRWRKGSDPDAAAALDEHRELGSFKSVVLDLAYEEYCLREETGSAPDAASFCARFGPYRSSVRKVIDAHRLVADHPELLTPESIEWPAPGQTFEGLELLGELGRGAFGRAYAAFDPQTSRPCVLKLTTGRSIEARVIGGLRHHPNVIDVYWAKPIDRLTAVCMPLVGVTTLDEVRDAAFASGRPRTADAVLAAIDPAGLPPADITAVVRPGEPYMVAVAAIAERIADALAHLHRSGVAHGDLKPSNVVLGPSGKPYLIDFNLSVAGEEPAATAGGTLPYMAPELLRMVAGLGGPQPGATAAKADIYAFGATVYELLTGQLPGGNPPTGHSAAAAAEQLARLSAPRPSLRQLAPGTPFRLALLIDKCLSADPAARPPAAEVAAKLGRVLRSARGRGARWRRGMTALALGSLALTGVACLLIPPGPGASRVQLQAPHFAEAEAEKPPETAAEYFERGVRFVRQSEFAPAYSDFSRSNVLQEDSRTLAYMAYCLGHMRQHSVAVDCGRLAIEKGAQGVAVRNNLGHSLVQIGKLEEAFPFLLAALEQSPQSREVRYNLALARYRLGQRHNLTEPDAECVADMDAVLASGPASPRLLTLAASIYAKNSALGPDVRARAIYCVVRAVQQGKPPVQLLNDPVLKAHLGGDPEFQKIAGLEAGTLSDIVENWLVEPDPSN